MAAAGTNFLIAHGSLGSPESNWFPRLKKKLEAEGHRVAAPVFPTPDNQSLESWLKTARAALPNADPAHTVLIGHSTGAVLVLRMAERTTAPYKAVFFICPFARDLGLTPYDELNASFARPAFDWARVKQGAKRLFCFAGSDDPYVPLDCVRDVAEKAGAALTVVEKGGHLNAESGYLEFPLLFDKIHETLSA
ncbi:MAG: serine hydrolase family protein [Alphaproteobacteria bacterium]|nr:serine hydrolase family protein [Alphaproteobacteria bacterium]